MVSTDLPEREQNNGGNQQRCQIDDFNAELQKWLRIHRLKVTWKKDKLVVRVENAKRAGVNPNSSCTPAGSRVRVPRGTLYRCVPLCHGCKGKVGNGKPVKLHSLPLDLKLRRQWIRKLQTIGKKKLSSKSRNTSV